MATASDISDDKEDELLALALNMSLNSFEEEQQWREISAYVLNESTKDEYNELRFVVIGESGSGKSQTSNSLLLCDDLFTAAGTARAVTKTCMIQKAEVFGRMISVVDTPGLFDADMDQQYLLREITRCIMMTAPGPHAILLVIRMGRMSKQVHQTVQVFREVFGEKCTDHMIVVFTGKNSLSDCRTSCTIDEYICTVEKDVADILKACENRYVVFENSVLPDSNENKEQVAELLSVVDKMLLSNGCRCYTNAMFEEAACKMKELEEKIRQQIIAEKQQEIQTVTDMYEKELREMEIEMTQNMSELIKENRDREIKEIEEKYSRRDARHEAQKNAANNWSWKTFLKIAPLLFKLGEAAVQLYLSFK